MNNRRLPSSDPELIELFGDEPELLAVTDAIHGTYRPRPRMRPIVTLAAAIVVALAAAALWPRGSGFFESALAAVGDDPVVHSIVRRAAPRTTVVELATGRDRPGMVEVETWYEGGTGLIRTMTRRGGLVVSDTVGLRLGSTRGGPGAEQAQLLTRSYRDALLGGWMRKSGRARVNGREVVWLLLPASGTTQRVAIDVGTHAPVAFEATVGGPLWSVAELTSVPTSPALFAPRREENIIVGGGVRESRAIPVGHTAKFGWTAWLGRRLGELSLSSTSLESLTRRRSDGSRLSSTGFELVYGSGTNAVRLRLAAEPEPAYGFVEGRLTFDFDAIPRPGRVAITKPARGDEWFGQLRYRKAFVTIAAPTRALLIAAARALRPL